MALISRNNAIVAMLAMLAAITAAPKPASAQLVLSCFTLHNDLANYDRRARKVRGYFMPDLETARTEARPNANRYYDHYCFELARQDCSPPSAVTVQRYERMKEQYLSSHLGGSDPVRLRIINEMNKLGCPLPDHVVELLDMMRADEDQDSEDWDDEPRLK